MCKAQSDGGARCAAHTRPAFNKVGMALNRLAPRKADRDMSERDLVAEDARKESEREKCRAAGFDAFADHAATPAGRVEVEQYLHKWEQDERLPGRHKDNMTGWIQSTLAEGEKRRAAAKDIEVHLRAQSTPASEAPRKGLLTRIADLGLAGEVGPLAPRILGRRHKA